MAILDVLADLWYRLAGSRTPAVSLAEFSDGFSTLVRQMIPVHRIAHLAGADYKGEWTEEKEEARVNAARAHLIDLWQPAHNAINDIKPPSRFRIIHRKAMMGSRAYGETLALFIEYQVLFLGPQYMTEPYYRTQKSGIQWDSVARDQMEDLLNELDQLAIRDQIAYNALVKPEDLSGLQSMVNSSMDAVAPFGLSSRG